MLTAKPQSRTIVRTDQSVKNWSDMHCIYLQGEEKEIHMVQRRTDGGNETFQKQ